MSRTPDHIRAELHAFESQFTAATIPAGTPDRRRLQREAYDSARAEACRPANVARRLSLAAELSKAVAAEKRRQTLAAKAADPQEQTRAWLMQWLRRLGFRREIRTGSGSAYYTCGECRVRLADHDVPWTAERQRAIDAGCWSWCTHGWSLRIDRGRMELARDLVLIRREVQKQEMATA